ncbi:ubiquitin-like domain-containing CTD phosphatase 1 isoform X1 [Gordionus sp. m RMFG-2023]|uniref:ubiquitin-like domain-containing CTD phosphatase 1 isoform X1 n=1 Tax=Gordionus sp. m RMFG-2023 TaxID=3053472 RepID=UPI0031FCF2BE
MKIFDLTYVLPKRQKLLGIKKNKPPLDEDSLEQLNIKSGTKLMMMGCNDELEEIEVNDNIKNDLDDNLVEEEINICQRVENLDKIEKRVLNYNIKSYHEPREGKYLLVLDIDGTIFDHKSYAERGSELMRPYLHEFLNTVYNYYDICIWSATKMKYIEAKVIQMGIIRSSPSNQIQNSLSASHNDSPPQASEYKINFFLDHNAMINVYTEKSGLIEVKPLAFIWGKFPGKYTPQNSIIVDDCRKNFLMNPQNGLRIYPFHNTHTDEQQDEDLLWLGKYLEFIAINFNGNFSELDHTHWKRYIKNKIKKYME